MKPPVSSPNLPGSQGLVPGGFIFRYHSEMINTVWPQSFQEAQTRLITITLKDSNKLELLGNLVFLLTHLPALIGKIEITSLEL